MMFAKEKYQSLAKCAHSYTISIELELFSCIRCLLFACRITQAVGTNICKYMLEASENFFPVLLSL